MPVSQVPRVRPVLTLTCSSPRVRMSIHFSPHSSRSAALTLIRTLRSTDSTSQVGGSLS
jgi:hypothetical protein